MIAALYVQADGVYANRADVDAWPESRDARLYAGPHPVVAHPPCATWGRYAHKAGGKGNDHGCFASALESVRCFGGVIEHPRGSSAWSRFGLPLPEEGPDAFGGWTASVCQYWWGHEAIKPTWLYIVGCNGITVEHWAIRSRLPLRPLEHLSKRQRAHTPPAFAQWLIELAEKCRGGVLNNKETKE